MAVAFAEVNSVGGFAFQTFERNPTTAIQARRDRKAQASCRPIIPASSLIEPQIASAPASSRRGPSLS